MPPPTKEPWPPRCLTRPRSIRLTDAEWERLCEIGRRLGPVKPLLPSDVIREWIRQEVDSRALVDQETAPVRPSRT